MFKLLTHKYMSNLVEYLFEGHQVRVVIIDNEPYFVAKDVTDILGYKQGSMAVQKHCKEKGTTKYRVLSKGGLQETVCINEPNLYRLVINSKMPNAEKFEEWVMEDVLPTIRKTGGFNIDKDVQNFNEIAKHYKRAMLNAPQVPNTHFSMVGEIAIRVLIPLQARGFDLKADCLPDGSLGIGFVAYLETIGADLSKIKKYPYKNLKGQTFQANMYPYEFYPYLQDFVFDVWLKGLGAKYFNERTKKLGK